MRLAKLTVRLKGDQHMTRGTVVRLVVEESGGLLTLRQVEGGPAKNRDGDALTATERFTIQDHHNGWLVAEATIDVEAP